MKTRRCGDPDRRDRDHGKTETDTGVMKLEAKECQALLSTACSQERCFPATYKLSADTLHARLLACDPGEEAFLLLHPPAKLEF